MSDPTQTSDPIVAMVRADILARSELGIRKYGVTLARNDLSERQWAQHHYEELLDAALYVKRRIIDMERAEAAQAEIADKLGRHAQ